MAFLESDIKVSGHNTPKRSRSESAKGLVRSPVTQEFKELTKYLVDKPMWNVPRS